MKVLIDVNNMQGVDIHVLCDNKVLQQLTQATFLYAPEKTLREESSVNMKISTVLKDLHVEHYRA